LLDAHLDVLIVHIGLLYLHLDILVLLPVFLGVHLDMLLVTYCVVVCLSANCHKLNIS